MDVFPGKSIYRKLLPPPAKGGGWSLRYWSCLVSSSKKGVPNNLTHPNKSEDPVFGELKLNWECHLSHQSYTPGSHPMKWLQGILGDLSY